MSWLPKLGSAGAKALGLAALLLSGALELKAQVPYIKEYPVPTPNSYPLGITAGPDGALWFTEKYGNHIGRITTLGVITEYPLPTWGTQPDGITVGPDGALWFTEYWAGKIGRITTAGVVTEYPASFTPTEITAGPDGALWFTESSVYKIGRITTAGAITEYPLPPPNSTPIGITAGPDGALWFTDPLYCAPQIGRITTTGIFTEYPLPITSVCNFSLSGIATGPDGALWFTEFFNASKIGRITTAGVITEYPVPTPNSNPREITSGPDGALWFTEETGSKIGRITTAGIIDEYALPSPGQPEFIAAGPDGALWFTDFTGNKIGQLVLHSSDTTKPVSQVSLLPPAEPVANFPVQWSGTDTGSGIHDFTIYVSDSAGPFAAWLTDTTATQATYSGILGHTYGFYSIARDLAGNQEDPKTAEAITYIASAPGDLSGDGAVNCADLSIVTASFGKRAGQPGYNPVADVNHDGVVNVRDLSWVAQYLPPGAQCP